MVIYVLIRKYYVCVYMLKKFIIKVLAIRYIGWTIIVY